MQTGFNDSPWQTTCPTTSEAQCCTNFVRPSVSETLAYRLEHSEPQVGLLRRTAGNFFYRPRDQVESRYRTFHSELARFSHTPVTDFGLHHGMIEPHV